MVFANAGGLGGGGSGSLGQELPSARWMEGEQIISLAREGLGCSKGCGICCFPKGTVLGRVGVTWCCLFGHGAARLHHRQHWDRPLPIPSTFHQGQAQILILGPR